MHRELDKNLTAMTRRWFLKSLAGAGAAGAAVQSAWPQILMPRAEARTKPTFEVIRPSASGIRWVHSNGRSPEMYLPETVGAGCAFLDYDNDGWMDIYLVNSGKCDFFDPDPLCATRSTRTIETALLRM